MASKRSKSLAALMLESPARMRHLGLASHELNVGTSTTLLGGGRVIVVLYSCILTPRLLLVSIGRQLLPRRGKFTEDLE